MEHFALAVIPNNISVETLMLIVAHALTTGATLVTRDEALQFRPWITVENWAE